MENKFQLPPKKTVKVNSDEALLRACNDHKTLSLYRFYRLNKKNGIHYFYYSCFIILPTQRQGFVRVNLMPDVGYVGRDEDLKRSVRNSSGYKLINFMYDTANGLELAVRASKNSEGKYTFSLYAISIDDSGTSFEMPMKVDNPADFAFLKSAFTSYSSCREIDQDDFDKLSGLDKAFENYLAPGQYPDVPVSEDVE